MEFANLFENVASTKRKSIPHLDQISDANFNKILKFIQSNSGILDLETTATEKIDGFGFRFGMDRKGNFFVESSRSGPIFEHGKFVEYAKRTGKREDIAKIYDDLFNLLNTDDIKDFLKLNNKNGIKIVCEALYKDNADVDGSEVKFLSITYDKYKLGTVLTLATIKIHDFENNELDLISDVEKLSTKKIKFIKPVIKQKIDLHNIVNGDLAAVTKREKIVDVILDSVKEGTLGTEYEGLVFNINGVMFKVVNKDFRDSKRKRR